jgi:hypothetical protein
MGCEQWLLLVFARALSESLGIHVTALDKAVERTAIHLHVCLDMEFWVAKPRRWKRLHFICWSNILPVLGRLF